MDLAQQQSGFIQVVVVTTATDLNASFDTQEPLQVVFERALSLVGGHNQADQFTLEYQDHPLSNLGRSIGSFATELGWGAEVELELVPKPVVV